MCGEQWLPVTGFEDLYMVSSAGNIRSLRTGKNLSNRPDKASGYVLVRLFRNGVAKTLSVHRLVATAFLGQPEVGQEVCHNDGVRHHNEVTNLRWDTRAGNQADKRRHGTQHELVKTHCPSNHEYTTENTYHNSGRRHCRECGRVRSRNYWRKKHGLDINRSMRVD